MMKGISFVICTFNGAARLPKTLEYLSQQKVEKSIPWEVVIIDNASMDNTTEVAMKSWPLSEIKLRVVKEPTPGVGYARLRGLGEAHYEYMVFVDDDNWIENNWVSKVFEMMEAFPDVAAFGSFNEAVCEAQPPAWFEYFKEAYAIGPKRQRGYADSFWSAGLAIRKSAWEQIQRANFFLHLSGRRGTSLLSGEDVELCYALRLAGWKLWFEPELKYRHFISRYKLNWAHMKNLHRGFGRTYVYLDVYKYFLGEKIDDNLSWSYALIQIIRKTIKTLLISGQEIIFRNEGSKQALQFEENLGSFSEMFFHRKKYRMCCENVRSYAQKFSKSG